MSDIKTLREFIRISYKAYKRYYFIVISQALFNAGLTIFNIYSLKLILDSVVEKTYDESLKIGLIIVIVNLTFHFLQRLFKRLVEVNNLGMKQTINHIIADKLMNVPYAHLEDPYYLDLRERAKFACDNQDAIGQMLNTLSKAIQTIIIIIGLITIIASFNILILGIVFVSVGLNSLIFFTSMKYQLKFYKELLPINRRYGYYLTTIIRPNFAKDYRLSNMDDLMVTKFNAYRNETSDYFVKLNMKFNKFTIFVELINYIQMGIVYLFVAVRTLKLGAGSFTLYVSSAMKLSSSISTLIELGMDFKRLIEYLKPLIEILNLKEEKDCGKIVFDKKIEKIEIKNLSFCYPRSNHRVLDNISFSINEGEKISIVGLNGAGKTTLVKLICRLYRPTEGEILINGINIYEYDYKSYINSISAIFQDYQLFAFSITENITNTDSDYDAAYECACKVGLKEKIDTLPKGIKSLYSKAYDEEGIEISGGEAQKIAIARALYKEASLVILDEPTSALDPIAEADIYHNFNNLVQEKTAIYISHRMSSSVFCDKVLIINQGKIADYDTHQNLMQKKDSLYYQLFSSQAKNYQID